MTHITLAVTGSISAYKAADITSQLTKLGIEVKVLMTPSAQKFITPLTLQVLSKNQVGLDVMVEDDPRRIEHIDIGKETHYARAFDNLGIELTKPLRFINAAQGYEG